MPGCTSDAPTDESITSSTCGPFHAISWRSRLADDLRRQLTTPPSQSSFALNLHTSAGLLRCARAIQYLQKARPQRSSSRSSARTFVCTYSSRIPTWRKPRQKPFRCRGKVMPWIRRIYCPFSPFYANPHIIAAVSAAPTPTRWSPAAALPLCMEEGRAEYCHDGHTCKTHKDPAGDIPACSRSSYSRVGPT